MDTESLRNVTLDLETMTLGEAGAAERASGLSLSAMLRTVQSRKLLSLWLHLSRTSVDPPSWSELSNLRLLDVSPSHSPAPRDSRSGT